MTEAEQHQAFVLSDRERREVQSILADLVLEHEPAPGRRPSPSPEPRWADVRPAAEGAVLDVEMAIVRAEREVESAAGAAAWRDGPAAIRRWTFHLWTIDDQPGELIVERVDDDADAAGVYIATARIGRGIGGLYDDHRAERLLAAFDQWMNALANKRRVQ